MPVGCSPARWFLRALRCAPKAAHLEQTKEASRKVVEANGRQPDGIADGELRYWIPTSADR
jgi:hypothetical protein